MDVQTKKANVRTEGFEGIDYLAMPGIARDTAQRGATLIVLDAEGGMNISQVPLAVIQTADF